MANQYTRAPGALVADGQAKTKFTVNLSSSEREALVRLSGAFEKNGSDIFRYFIGFLTERLATFKADYPNLPTYNLPTVLQAYYDAGRVRLEAERVKEHEQMERYQQAREMDGGKVNYEMDRLALAFHVRSWHSGKSAIAELRAFAEERARLGREHGIDWAADPSLRQFLQSDPAQPTGPTRPNPAQPGPDGLAQVERWFLVALGLVVLLALGLAGSWAWFLTR